MQEKAFGNVFRKMSAILSRPQRVKLSMYMYAAEITFHVFHNVNSLHAELFWGEINMYLDSISFLHIEMAQVV